ncbi:4Fe-4S dicluster domain-containing protein [Ellagibacter isourolithinifaciens]|uniref:4Fe-4S dicluster domain-containing protein n=1 Tax=Ellagibacter isourolithinifaciens TaxID=2137581 RepID=UPI003AAAD389
MPFVLAPTQRSAWRCSTSSSRKTCTTPTSQCDLCAERTAGGKLPTCVNHCLAGIMKFGPINQLVEELDKKPNQVLFVPGPYTCKA